MVLIETQYLPTLDFFTLELRYGPLLLEAQETYQKQTYRNRAYVHTVQGPLPLSVPVRGGSQRQLVTEVEIDNSRNWATLQWRSIRTAYGSAPFFIYYAERFEAVLADPPALLWDLNRKMLTICRGLLELPAAPQSTQSFEKSPSAEIFDARNLINPKKPAIFSYPGYYQVFGNKFDYFDKRNPSVLDLLFCEGPNARRVLAAAKVRPDMTRLLPDDKIA